MFLKKERITMKTTIALAAIAATAGLASAADLVVDVSGVNSWGFQGDALNESLAIMVGANANVSNIAWDVNLTTVGLSWADENTMDFAGGAAIINVGLGDAFTVTNMNYSGSLATNIDLAGDGLLNVDFYEVGFDDNPGSVDSFYEAGSTITISYTPTPGSLAVLGLGGIVAGRRRR
jgi:uncharacterized protein (TIGR03382 family)